MAKEDTKPKPNLVELEAELLWPNFVQLWEELRQNPANLPPAIKELVMNAKRQIGAAEPLLIDDAGTDDHQALQSRAEAQHEVISAYLWHLDHSRRQDPKGLPKRIIKILDAMLVFRNSIRATLPRYLEGEKVPKKKPVPVPKRR